MPLDSVQVAQQLTSDEFKHLFQIVMVQFDQEFSVLGVDRQAKRTTVRIRLRNGLEKRVRLP